MQMRPTTVPVMTVTMPIAATTTVAEKTTDRRQAHQEPRHANYDYATIDCMPIDRKNSSSLVISGS